MTSSRLLRHVQKSGFVSTLRLITIPLLSPIFCDSAWPWAAAYVTLRQSFGPYRTIRASLHQVCPRPKLHTNVLCTTRPCPKSFSIGCSNYVGLDKHLVRIVARPFLCLLDGLNPATCVREHSLALWICTDYEYVGDCYRRVART